jgi:hypothetical protein
MSFRVVRQSKYRHVFGQQKKKEECLDGLRISRNAWDSNFCSVNPVFLAVVLEAQGGGSFQVLPHSQVGKIGLDYPKVSGHTAAVLDVQFCPYNDYVIASASEDCTVKVWQLPEGGLPYDPKDSKKNKDLTDPVVTLIGHQRRVGIVEWHPNAENILVSAGFDYLVIIWDVSTGKPLREIQSHTDTIFSMSFNWDGSLLATTCKDRMIRIIDPRTGTVVQQGQGHEGAKSFRVTFCGELNRLFTTGFSKVSERQFAVWDPADLSTPLKMEMIDTGSGVLFPYFDNDTGLVYVAGKGDGNIRYFELEKEQPYAFFLSEYKSATPQRGLGWLPKRGLNVGECEIGRCYKLTPKGTVEIVSFIVPRKSTLFQEDIFPPTREEKCLLSGAKWWAGENGVPTKFSLKDGYTPPARAELASVEQPASTVDEADRPPEGEKALLKAWHSQREEIKLLKAQLASSEIKIRQLTVGSS